MNVLYVKVYFDFELCFISHKFKEFSNSIEMFYKIEHFELWYHIRVKVRFQTLDGIV